MRHLGFSCGSPSPVPSSGELRAKHLRLRAYGEPDPADAFATSAVFDLAMRRCRLSNVEVAKYLGVDESVVREMRNAERVLTAPRIQRLPRELAIEVLRGLLRLFGEE
jgi:hypothetical protein